MLISTATTVFHYYKCHRFDIHSQDGGDYVQYMYKDYSIDCRTARYKLYGIYAGIMIFIYPIGIPFMYYSLLKACQSTLSDPMAMDREAANDYPTVGHMTFLVRAYTPKHYNFEVFDCLRRIMLGAFIGMLPDGAVSPVAGLLVCFVFTYVFVEFR